MRRFINLTVLAALLVASPASAAVRVPLPNPLPAVSDAPCPGLDGEVACFSRATFTVYLTQFYTPHTDAHEFGHAFDQQRLDDGERSRYRSLAGLPQQGPWFDPNPNDDDATVHAYPGERFADDYADCRLGYPKRDRRICRFLWRARDLPS